MKLGNYLVAMLVVPALILTVGCKKPTPVGKWSGNYNNIPATFEFKDGGQMTVSATAPVVGQVTLSGTWAVEGDKLSTNLTTGNPPAILTMIPADKRKASETFKLEGETLTIGQGQPMTRVKE
ncbi:MAG: hypothetical protein NTX57_20440 [Armatimonadetes bacterium]|jgi:hypothetical protein|nr:hypothetical protein [Armatimonadota bacterium]